MKHLQLFILVALLCVGGAGLMLYKTLVLDYPLRPGQQADVWHVEATLTAEALKDEPMRVNLVIPRNPPGFLIWDENFISRGYGLNVEETEDWREAEWTLRRARGEQVFFYRAVVSRLSEALVRARPDGEIRPKAPVWGDAEKMAAGEVMATARQRSVDTRSLVLELHRLLNQPLHGEGDPVRFLLDNDSSGEGKLRLMVNLLNSSDIPARLVRGLYLTDQQRNITLSPALEFYDRKWVFFNPAAGGQFNRPDNFLIWLYNTGPVARSDYNGGTVQLQLAVKRLQEDAIQAAIIRGERYNPSVVRFSLLNLPVDSQVIYQILMLIPIGSLILVVCRNVIGFKVFGTFMPVLIALSFRDTGVVWGIMLYTIVVGCGLCARFYLDKLNLLFVPRLSAVLIIVVVVMAAVSIFSHRFDFNAGLAISLFPMVILTVTIERMSVVWEEHGAREALLQALGSMVVSLICYPVMFNPQVQYLVFVFPETLCFFLAAILLLGRYTGYRLTELKRFRHFTTNQP